jgi:hypothetical protein
MQQRDHLHQIANELPFLVRQLESNDPILRAAGLMRLRDLARVCAARRGGAEVRSPPTRAGASFVALSGNRDD